MSESAPAPEYEFCIMHRRFPLIPHRGPMSEEKAHEWIQEARDDGFKGNTFYVARRSVGQWEEVDEAPGAVRVAERS